MNPEKSDRNALVAQLRQEGATVQQLSDRFSLTPQRIGRILESQARNGPDESKGVPCEACGSSSRTLETRRRRRFIYRRHECLNCLRRWSSQQRNLS